MAGVLGIPFTFQSGYIQMLQRMRLYEWDMLLYIPIWLYSNLLLAISHPFIFLLYIPIWLYSNAPTAERQSKISYLYIPIWLYSNEQGTARIAGLLAFTFQSGYIQILKCQRNFYILKFFTFQSGYIQIHLDVCQKVQHYSLHSNLVIFK